MKRCDVPMSYEEAKRQGLDVGGPGWGGRAYVPCPRECMEGMDVCEEHWKARAERATNA